MDSNAYRLTVLNGDQSGKLRPDICFVSADTYPLNSPYRQLDTPLTGRMYRILNIAVTTSIVKDDDTWDKATRTLTIPGGFRTLLRRMGASTARDTSIRIREILEALTATTIPTPDGGQVTPIERLALSDKGVVGTRVTFNATYVDMTLTNPKRIPLNAIAGTPRAPFGIDMLVLAALYCPDDRRLIIPKDELPRILPKHALQTLTPSSVRARLNRLNTAQTWWKFALNQSGNLTIIPTDVWVPEKHSVTLVRSTASVMEA